MHKKNPLIWRRASAIPTHNCGPILGALAAIVEKIMGPSKAIGSSCRKCNATPFRNINLPILDRRQPSQKHQWANPTLSAAPLRNINGPTLRRRQLPLKNMNGPILGHRQHPPKILMGLPHGVGSASQKYRWANPMASAAPLRNINGPIPHHWQHLSEISMGQCYSIVGTSQK
jgi:hypothetical protein